MTIGAKKIIWENHEYEHRERNTDWFWALGIITVSVSAASIIFKNYLFAILILLIGFVLAMYRIREPKVIHFELNERGVRIRNQIYPYARLKSFFIEHNHKTNEQKLLIESEKPFVPLLIIPIEEKLEGEIKELLQNFLPMKELHEPISHKIMDYLGL